MRLENLIKKRNFLVVGRLFSCTHSQIPFICFEKNSIKLVAMKFKGTKIIIINLDLKDKNILNRLRMHEIKYFLI